MRGNGTPSVRVVIVTLDNHLAAAVERANSHMAHDNVSIGFYAASDWDRDPGVLECAKADIASADIIIATMLFLEDHVRAIHPAMLARREQCDAIVGISSTIAQFRLIQYSYFGRLPFTSPTKNLSWRKKQTVVRNLPPATVWGLEKS